MSDGSLGVAKPVSGIDPGVSSYLDLMRVFAAIVVVLSHLLPDLLGIYAVPGHDAVIVFFVISGYVIAFAAEQRDRTVDRFIVNRLARLWSVLIPSLVISGIAAVVVAKRADIMFAPAITKPGPFLRAVFSNVFFLGQNWFFDSPAPFNEPVWSLNYEAWYYAVFAAFIFAPSRWRWHAAALAVLLAGPAIIALMPCWLLGTWLYRRRDRLTMPAALAYLLFAVCIVLYWAFSAMDVSEHCRTWLSTVTGNHSYRLRGSTRCVGDFIEACLFSGTIIGVRSMPALNRGFAVSGSVFRTASSRTFSLYIYHIPVFAILCGGLGIGRKSTPDAFLCIALVMTFCVLLGAVTEAKLASWRRVVRWVFDAVRSGAGALSGAPS